MKFITILFCAFACGAWDPLGHKFGEVERAAHYAKPGYTPPSVPPKLKVMTWNIKFGGGRINFFFDCISNRSLMDQNEVESNLEAVLARIKLHDPDVLFLQEVDVSAKRSAYVDQVLWLLTKSDFGYAVYASNWKVRFVPNAGIGKVDTGGAIFSKFPLTGGVRIRLPLIDKQDKLEKYFYLRRALLKADLDVGTKLSVYNIHLTAYAQDATKQRQIGKLLSQINHDPQPAMVAGDFNIPPPDSTTLKDFPDEHCEGDFEGTDHTLEVEWMRPFYEKLQPAIPLADYLADEKPHFTHNVDPWQDWSRKIDYIFVPKEFTVSGADTDEDTHMLSDHAPLVVEIEL